MVYQWTAEAVKALRQLKSEGFTYTQIAETMGLPSSDSARHGWRRYGNGSDPIPQSTNAEHSCDGTILERATEIAYKNKKNPENMPLNEMLDAFATAQAFRDGFSINQLTAEVEIKSKTPIALSHISDAHIGSPYTNYAALIADLSLIAGDPRLYVGIGGDMADNFAPQFKDKRAPMNSLQPAHFQLLTVEKILDTLRGSIIATIGGNHDGMPDRVSGMDSQYFIRRDKPFPHLPGGGLIKLTVGEVVYKILWKHQYRFKSSLNQFNSHHRMLELLEPTADIVVQEHEHSPGIESLEVGEFDSKRTVVNIRTGAYKISDPFSVDFYKSGRRGPQTVVLWPDQRKVLAFHGDSAIADAQIYLNGYEKKNSKKG